MKMVEERKWGETRSFGPRQWLRHKLLVDQLQKHLSQGIVLDAGCGEGKMAEMIAEKGFQVFAFDESRDSLKEASALGVDTRGADTLVCPAKKVVHWLGKLDQIPFPNNSFDAIIAGDVLEHIENDQKAVQEFFQVLKPGGLAIISVPADPKKWSIDDDWSGHKRRYRKADVLSLFQAAGFKLDTCYFWGWPITWLYYRLFYIPMLKKRFKERKVQAGLAHASAQTGLAGLKDSKLLEIVFWLAFLPDQLFLGTKWGIGLIGVFRKSTT